MAKFSKWLGGGLGWALGGPIGAIIGFVVGSLVDESQVTTHRVKTNTSSSGVNDFMATLLVLSAAVIKSDGKTTKLEIEYVRKFLAQQFGTAKASEAMFLLREILKQEIPLQNVCLQIKHYMPLASRLQLLHYLYGISNADGHINDAEIEIVERIAYYLGISTPDQNSIKAMYYRDANSDYKILEISSDVTDEELKKSYRKMAMKFHPDRVASLGEDVQKAANEKFKKVQQAYENIKKQRMIMQQ
ncbi:MAG: TerB family tellurite resistance protein [Bacteroidota bacterium]